jgi:hypothetical protein
MLMGSSAAGWAGLGLADWAAAGETNTGRLKTTNSVARREPTQQRKSRREQSGREIMV